ncbi:Hypothetical protein Cp99MAT_0663 [Corynebacterium pseudotuberculosis]|nr:Hypothetical protein Cp3995_2040 [Corynebacterium pseudotuberculosis 3/99-5]AIG06211.1 hypothetical protein CPTA_00382 [Corynebacterium pseudotuberculosis]AIG09203.1 hypothetical protein CPTB_01147 [Corynebacterium pseudotuberculosis]AIG11103.1 hypothetical protein CPTC_00815 [Corynebacterium pseudotuberculosis]ARS60163.1 Hypothetical protein CpATCC19410_0682 [Corynebacterium pseudotuberculosis]
MAAAVAVAAVAPAPKGNIVGGVAAARGSQNASPPVGEPERSDAAAVVARSFLDGARVVRSDRAGDSLENHA